MPPAVPGAFAQHLLHQVGAGDALRLGEPVSTAVLRKRPAVGQGQHGAVLHGAVAFVAVGGHGGVYVGHADVLPAPGVLVLAQAAHGLRHVGHGDAHAHDLAHGQRSAVHRAAPFRKSVPLSYHRAGADASGRRNCKGGNSRARQLPNAAISPFGEAGLRFRIARRAKYGACVLRPLPLLRLAASAAGGARLCSLRQNLTQNRALVAGSSHTILG